LGCVRCSGDLRSTAKRLSWSAIRADHETLPGLEGFDHESARVAPDGDGAMWPGAQKGGAPRAIGLRRTQGAARRALAGNDYSWLRPPGEFGRVREPAPVMRSHEDVCVDGIQRQDAGQARAFQGARQEQRMAC